MQLQANRPHTFAHHLDGASATARVPNFVQAMTGRGGDLLPGHIGDGARRLAEDPRVDHDRIAAERADPVTHVLDLGALGVKGPYQGDVWTHGAHRTTAPGPGLAGFLFAFSQMAGRGLDIAVVILLWDGSGAGVAQELDQPF